MFFSTALVLSTALTAAQSAAADAVAVRYLTAACTDGTERIGVVSAGDGVLHDLSRDRTRYTVGFDEEAFRALCPQGPLVAYHCHPTRDPLSLFPGLGEDGRSSDFGTVAFLEFMCAEEGTTPVIEHRIVHTGGTGTVVRFGLRGASLERARGLGRQIADVIPDRTPTVNRYGAPDLSELLRVPARIKGIHEGLNELYAALHNAYGREVLGFLRKTCPTAKTEEDLRACTAFTLESFIKTMEPCGDRFIMLPGTKPPVCAPATGERILIGGPRYAGWTELTPKNYDSFTARGSVVLAFCDDGAATTGRPCSITIPELDRRLPQCHQLHRGYVDTSRNAPLVGRHTQGMQEVALLQDGRRYAINVPNPGKWLFRLILCGPETLFPNLPN